MNFRFYFLFLAVCLTSLSHAQDIVVQAFNYNSTTRDTLIEFPQVDHNDYEKILMYYSMRCKDGRVSPPIAGRTNEGCGEWDYSCNTYITDSTYTDSLFTIGPSHSITNFSGTEFDFTSQPTYSYYQSFQKNVSSDFGQDAEEFTVGQNEIATKFPGRTTTRARSQMLYTVDQLNNSGLSAGNISGLKLQVTDDQATFNNLRLALKHSSRTDLSSTVFDNDDFTPVAYASTPMSTVDNTIKFHTPFEWDGVSNVLVDISFSGTDESEVLIAAEVIDDSNYLVSDSRENKLVEFNGSSSVQLEQGFPEITNEITIAFWTYGDDRLPANTSLFEGVDDQNRRQANVHLPWSDGNIYWDCGNNGSGYDRISKAVSPSDYKNKWTHWTLTKNASSGFMRIYLNGELWHSASDRTHPINIKNFVLGSRSNGNNPYFGKIDNFSVWSKELSEENIKKIMGFRIGSNHPDYNNLVLNYDFNEISFPTLPDLSASNYDGIITGPLLQREHDPRIVPFSSSFATISPVITFIQEDNPSISFDEIEVLDSLQNGVHQVDEFIVNGTDLELNSTNFYFQAGDMPVYSENGSIVESITIPAEGTITLSSLEYFRKSPAKFELVSFVTPYGINLDLGIEGHTWTFDVTDFGPILKGNRRINMQWGGQWQEDIDIKFVFVEGTPSRDVYSISQIWPVTSSNYTRINNNEVYEPRMVPIPSNAEGVKLKAAITGHGQEGEFIPRTHLLDVDGFPERSWRVWKECSLNPIYPQGGTWIFDRAGWCPGEATDVEEVDITEIITPGTPVEIDYDVATASGDSRYIVNVQMVSYGAPNFELDAELLDIINPTTKIEHGRFNPACTEPSVRVRNNGSTRIRSLDIIYGIDGKEQTHSWAGNLDFLDETVIRLPLLDLEDFKTSNLEFTARVSNPNGVSDEYASNNEISTPFKLVEEYEKDLVISFLTNSQAAETSYSILDAQGNTIASRQGGLSPNTTYLDTLRNLDGCYRLIVRDLDDDGLSFFANNDGDGNIRIKNLSDRRFTQLADDFGRQFIYEFVAGDIISSNQEENPLSSKVRISPNPSHGQFTIGLYGQQAQLRLINQAGKMVRDIFVTNNDTGVFKYEMDISNEPDGVYFLITSTDQGTHSSKLIKLND